MDTLTTAERIVMDIAGVFTTAGFEWAETAYHESLAGNLRSLLDEWMVRELACFDFDEDWFPILATRAIADSLDWEKLNMLTVQEILKAFPEMDQGE